MENVEILEEGFGPDAEGTYERLEELRKSYGLGSGFEPSGRLIKALQAGSGSTWGSTTSGAPLRYEDLEQTFIVTTFGAKHMEKTLFSRLLRTKVAARDVAHQFNRVTGWGTGGPWNAEIADLDTQDVSLARSYADVKFARTKRRVSDVMIAVAGGERAEFLQVRGGNMFLAENAERYLFDGNASIISYEPTGIFPTIGANGTVGIDVIDLLGEAPTSEDLENIMEAMVDTGTYGSVTDLYTPTKGGTCLQVALSEAKERVLVYPDERGNFVNNIPVLNVGTPNASPGFITGRSVNGFASRHGLMAIWDSPFVGLRETVPTAATSDNAPTLPTITAARQASVTGSTVRNPEDLGVYRVRVSAENVSGESLASTAATATLTAAGDGIRVAITAGATAGLAYRIYCSQPGGAAGDERLVARVAYSASPQNFDISFNPLTQRRPHTWPAYVLQIPPDEEEEMRAIGLASLAIGRKILPEGDTYRQWSQFHYYAVPIYAPAKMKLIANMGKSTYTNGWPT